VSGSNCPPLTSVTTDDVLAERFWKAIAFECRRRHQRIRCQGLCQSLQVNDARMTRGVDDLQRHLAGCQPGSEGIVRRARQMSSHCDQIIAPLPGPRTQVNIGYHAGSEQHDRAARKRAQCLAMDAMRLVASDHVEAFGARGMPALLAAAKIRA